MDIQFMKDYYDLRYEETDGENHFVEEKMCIRDSGRTGCGFGLCLCGEHGIFEESTAERPGCVGD